MDSEEVAKVCDAALKTLDALQKDVDELVRERDRLRAENQILRGDLMATETRNPNQCGSKTCWCASLGQHPTGLEPGPDPDIG